MLTRCTNCLTWFRVRAEHLSVAGGQVTCGHCDAVFDALASLIEEEAQPPVLRAPPPAASAVPSPPPGVDTLVGAPDGNDLPAPAADIPATPYEPLPPAAAAAEPAFDADVTTETVTIELPLSIDDVPVAHDVSVEPDAITPLAPASSHILPADEHAILFTAPGSDTEVDDTVPEARGGPDQLYDELAALSPPPQRAAGPAWFVLGALLAITLAAQFAWSARERIERLWPASAPLYVRLCTVLACPSAVAPPAIRLVARDVREHPQYRGALLVNATLVNDAPSPQPFPDIELRLHDAGGNTIGARRFAATEYLDQSIAIAAGMPTARPVYIVMELGGDAASAVSFEFTFM